MNQKGITAFVPYLSVHDGNRAIEFYSKVFNIAPQVCLRMPDGRVMHCEFVLETTKFFLSDELPEHGGTPSPFTAKLTTMAIHLYVDDCDDIVRQFSTHGSELLMPPTDMFWGERFARVRDPFGHVWGIATIIQTLTPKQIQVEAEKLFREMGSNSNDA